MTEPIDKPIHAVALTYEPEDGAPRVVAKGKGFIAEEIVRRAREAGVFVHESPELISLLMQVDLDDRIPPTLYLAIAELLARIYKLEQGGEAAPPPAAPPTPLPIAPASPNPQGSAQSSPQPAG